MAQARRKYPRTLFEAHEIPTPQHDRIQRWLDQVLQEEMAEKEVEPLSEWLLSRAEGMKPGIFKATTDCRQRVAEKVIQLADAGQEEAARDLAWSLECYPKPETCVEFPPSHEIGKITWEKPVIAPDGFVAGFVDVWCEYTKTTDIVAKKYDYTDYPEFVFEYLEGECRSIGMGYEIKPRIDSVGAVIRQLRFYETYLPADKYTIVAPEGAYRKDFEYQGFGFMPIPVEVLSGAWDE